MYFRQGRVLKTDGPSVRRPQKSSATRTSSVPLGRRTEIHFRQERKPPIRLKRRTRERIRNQLDGAQTADLTSKRERPWTRQSLPRRQWQRVHQRREREQTSPQKRLVRQPVLHQRKRRETVHQ